MQRAHIYVCILTCGASCLSIAPLGAGVGLREGRRRKEEAVLPSTRATPARVSDASSLPPFAHLAPPRGAPGEQNGIYPAFSGHNLICTATALLESGMVPIAPVDAATGVGVTKFALEVRGVCVSWRARRALRARGIPSA